MYLSIGFVFGVLFSLTAGHGYMSNPPARNCMLRYGLNNPVNLDDNQLNCGGSPESKTYWTKCGVCGDAPGSKQEHADNGKYSNGIIGKTYRRGQVIDVEVVLTTSRYGYFEFRIGDFSKAATTGNTFGVLKGDLLQLESGDLKYWVNANRAMSVNKIRLQLPSSLRCNRCVIQWWYQAGDKWGCNGLGCGKGKGPQEQFVNCADVSIY